MQIDKLIPMTAFVLEHPATTDYEWQLGNILRYASFLSQPLTLGMFVNTILEPHWTDDYETECGQDIYQDEMDAYNQAQSKVLFEGFTICNRGTKNCVNNLSLHLFGDILQSKTIEYLCRYQLTITPTAKTLIYGR